MNILTKNRIIEEGDQWKDDKGNWHPVHTKQIGLQIMFSDYKEVRRPTEQAYTPKEPRPEAVRAQSNTPEEIRIAETGPKVKPFKEPLTSLNEDLDRIADKEHEHAVAHLPTVISTKAHKSSGSLRESAIHAATPASVKIDYTDLSALPNWIGRNGTFKAVAVNLARTKNGLVQIRPMGKRGLAKNALIEIPVADIPNFIRALDRLT